MTRLIRALQWLLKAFIFFTLFAFALNNQSDIRVHFFFGTQWTAPVVIVVLAAFAAGLVVGVLGMLPRWWRLRKAFNQSGQTITEPAASTASSPPLSSSAASASTAPPTITPSPVNASRSTPLNTPPDTPAFYGP